MVNYATNPPIDRGQQSKPAQQDAIDSFLGQLTELENERQTAIHNGLPALQRLASIAQGDTGQAVTVRRFLLGLYDGCRWPFDLTSLRGLDKDLFDDSIDVLTLDARATVREVHQYFENGDELFEHLARLEG